MFDFYEQKRDTIKHILYRLEIKKLFIATKFRVAERVMNQSVRRSSTCVLYISTITWVLPTPKSAFYVFCTFLQDFDAKMIRNKVKSRYLCYGWNNNEFRISTVGQSTRTFGNKPKNTVFASYFFNLAS